MNDDKFYKGLRDGEIRHHSTMPKNSLLAVWSTEPVRRMERSFKKKDMTLLKRSGYNMIIDSNKNISPPPVVGENLKKNSLLKLSNYKNKNIEKVSRDFN